MTAVSSSVVKAKKVWTAPSLKKTSIELITANANPGGSNDGHPAKS
jgi:hypothetical protein